MHSFLIKAHFLVGFTFIMKLLYPLIKRDSLEITRFLYPIP